MGLTDQEKAVIALAAGLWNALLELPVIHPDDNEEHARDIHDIQNRILSRVALRSLMEEEDADEA